VQIDAAWRLPWDRHPNARAARSVAAAVVSKLQGQLAVAPALQKTAAKR
jgi:hypothetical protein